MNIRRNIRFLTLVLRSYTALYELKRYILDLASRNTEQESERYVSKTTMKKIRTVMLCTKGVLLEYGIQ